MRNPRPLILTIVCIGLLWASVAGAGKMALAPGDPAPKLTGKLHTNNVNRFVDFTENKLTLVNFWATWCKPCLDEIPKLQALHERRAADGLEIIGLYAQDENPERVTSYLAPLGVGYTLIRFEPQVDTWWGGIGAWPTSFLVDGDGKILRRYVGALPEQTDGLVADVEAVLEGRPMPPMVIPETEIPSKVKLPRRY